MRKPNLRNLKIVTSETKLIRSKIAGQKRVEITISNDVDNLAEIKSLKKK